MPLEERPASLSHCSSLLPIRPSCSTNTLPEAETTLDTYGYYMDEEDANAEATMVRQVWLDIVGRQDDGASTAVCAKKSQDDIEKKPHNSELFKWFNQQPAIANKFLSNPDMGSAELSAGMSVSGCVSGFRIVQCEDGVHAEFCVVFCYGSRTYQAWKRYSEFNALSKIIDHLHSNVHPMFQLSLAAWELVIRNRRWFRCLGVRYLIKKSIFLGKFIQCLLFETPSPGLILDFVRNSLSDEHVLDSYKKVLAR